MTKPARTVEQLQALLIERIEAIPDLHGQTNDVHRGGVIWMDPSHENGPNRTVRAVSDRRASQRHRERATDAVRVRGLAPAIRSAQKIEVR